VEKSDSSKKQESESTAEKHSSTDTDTFRDALQHEFTHTNDRKSRKRIAAVLGIDFEAISAANHPDGISSAENPVDSSRSDESPSDGDIFTETEALSGLCLQIGEAIFSGERPDQPVEDVRSEEVSEGSGEATPDSSDADSKKLGKKKKGGRA
jgi:hypothetical protein